MDPTQFSNAGLQSLNNSNNRSPVNLPTGEVVSSQDSQSQTPVVSAEPSTVPSPVTIPTPPVIVSPPQVVVAKEQPVQAPVVSTPPISVPVTPIQTFSLMPQIPVMQKPVASSETFHPPVFTHPQASASISKPVSQIPKPPVVAMPPAFFNNNFLAQSQSHSHWKMIIAIVFLVIVAGGVGAYAGYTYMFSPDRSILPAIGKIDSAKLIHSGVKISLDSSDLMFNGSSLSVATDVDRSFDSSESVKAGVAVDLVNPSLSASAELRFIDNVIYGRISKFPALYASYLSGVGNKWYSISLDTIKTAGASYGVASTTSQIKPVSPSEVYNRLVSASVLKDQKLVGIKSYSGSYVRQYSITIDKNALAKLTDSVPSIGQQNAYEEQAKALAKEQMNQIVISPILINLDLWSGSLRSIETSISYSPTAKDPVAKAMTIKLLLTYDDSMKSLSIDIPEGVMAMDSYVKESLEPKDDKTKDKINAIISSTSQIGLAMKSYYASKTVKSYAGGCKTSTDIKTLSDSIRTNGSIFTCRDSAKTYIVYSSISAISAISTSSISMSAISTSTQSYFCVDSAGTATTTKKAPTGFVCK